MGEDNNGIVYKEKTLTVVLESVLNFIINSYEKVKDAELPQSKNSFRIIYRFNDNSAAKELKQDNVQDIFNYNFSSNQEKNIEGSIYVKFNEYVEFVKVNYELPVKKEDISDKQTDIEKSAPIYDTKFLESIEDSFMDKELKKNLIVGLDSFTDKLYTLTECNQFPDISDIDECLKVYYKLLIDLMEGEFVKKRIIEKSFLQKLLNFDGGQSVDYEDCISLYSPIVLNNL